MDEPIQLVDDPFEDYYDVDSDYHLQDFVPSKVEASYNNGKYTLLKDLVINFSTIYVDGMTIIDNYRLTIKAGYSIEGSPFPKFLNILFPAWDSNMYNAASFFLSAMYNETGCGLFSREDCDNYYMTVLGKSFGCKTLKPIRNVIGHIFVGSNLDWSTEGDEIDLIMLETVVPND